MRGHTYAFHSPDAINKIWHFHPKPRKRLFQDPLVVGLASGGASRHTCSWRDGIELLQTAAERGLLTPIRLIGIQCSRMELDLDVFLFCYWENRGDWRPLERHELGCYFTYIKGKGSFMFEQAHALGKTTSCPYMNCRQKLNVFYEIF